MKTLKNLIVLLTLCAFAFSCGGDGKDAEEVTDNAVYLKVVVHYGDDTTDEPNDLFRLKPDDKQRVMIIECACFGSNALEIAEKKEITETQLRLFSLKDDYEDDETAKTKTAVYLIPYAKDGYGCSGNIGCSDKLDAEHGYRFACHSGGSLDDEEYIAEATLKGTGTNAATGYPTVKCGETLTLEITRAYKNPDYTN